MSLLPVDEALERILARIPQPRHETITLAQANGRVLADPLTAAHNQPPFSSSAMDGYAVRSVDVVPGQPLRMIGTAQAGQRFAGLVGERQCVRIFTGAPMPIGADAVIMQEDASSDGNFISFGTPPAPGRNVRQTGMDFARGEVLLPPGTLLTPQSLALAAAANQPKVTVARRLKIGLLATGDELVAPGALMGSDQIVASNSYGLVPMLAPYTAELVDLGIVPDDLGQIDAALLKAIDAGVDLIITTGGASVGDRDYMQTALKNVGVTLDFWRIAMRPGKPLMFGTRGRTLVFGLPGNPVSALVTAAIFIKPALRKWLGVTDPLAPMLRLPLAAPTPPNTARRHFMRAIIDTPLGEVTSVRPIAETDSGHVSSLARADALIVQPEDDPGQAAGTIVDVVPLGAF